jgi:hypothetical protein
LRRWSNVEYDRYVAARQNTFDRVFEGADLLITNATPSGSAESERDEKAAWEQTQALMQGVIDLASELNKADLRYQTRNRSKVWKLDAGWYPTSMYDAMEDPEHAVNKWTRPFQWLQREAINNLRNIQSLARPRMTRKVLTPGQDEENGDDRRGGETRGEAGPILRLVLRGDTRIREADGDGDAHELVRRANGGMDGRRVCPCGTWCGDGHEPHRGRDVGSPEDINTPSDTRATRA